MSAYAQLSQFVAMVVAAHQNGVSLIALRLSLTKEGMSEEEVSALLEVVALEVRMIRGVVYATTYHH